VGNSVDHSKSSTKNFSRVTRLQVTVSESGYGGTTARSFLQPARPTAKIGEDSEAGMQRIRRLGIISDGYG
jgi:hypothetical protein